MQNFTKALRYLIIVLIAALFVHFFVSEWDNFKTIKIEQHLLLIPIALCHSFLLASNGLLTQVWYKDLGLKLGTREWLGLSVVNTIGNFITPFRGGSISQAVYLKKAYDFNYSHFIGCLAVTTLIAFWVNSFFGLAALGYMEYSGDQPDRILWGFFILAFLAFTIVLAIPLKLNMPQNKYLEKFVLVINAWHELRKRKQAIVFSIILATINLLLIQGATLLGYQALGFSITALQAFVISIFSTFSLFISITPGNLGVREALNVFSANALGVGIPATLAASILDRLLQFSVTFAFSAYFSVYLSRKLKE